jgi:hypothetical protein
VAGSCKHRTEPSGTMKDGGVLSSCVTFRLSELCYMELFI